MRTHRLRGAIPRTLVVALVPTLALLGCSGDDETTTTASTSTESPTTTIPATTTTEGDATIVVESVPATADLPNVSTGGSSDLPAPPDTSDLGLVVEVTVGVDDAPDRIEQVPVGTPVTLRIVNPTSLDEYHVHGIDLGDGIEFAAGQTASFTFTLDAPGEYEVESHATNNVLVVLQGV